MKQKKITNDEIRKYWRKIIRKSFEPIIKRDDMRWGFLGVMFLLFAVCAAGIGVMFGLVPQYILQSQFNNFITGYITFWGSIILAIIVFLVALYRTPAELERIQEINFVSAMKKRNDEIRELRENLKSKIREAGIDFSIEFPEEGKMCISVINTNDDKKIYDCRAELVKMYILEEGKEPFDFTDGLDRTNLRFLWENNGEKIDIDHKDHKFLILAQKKETYFDILFSREPFSYRTYPHKEKGRYDLSLGIKIQFDGKLENNVFRSKIFRQEIRYEVRFADDGERFVELYAKDFSAE